MKILLLSAYDTDSHRYWRQGIMSHLPEIEWTTLTLPPRHFNWRIRGNPLSWIHDQRTALQQPYDALVATSMVDVATLRGIFPTLAMTPTLVYFHENQFAFPHQAPNTGRLEPRMVNLYSAISADIFAFNSEWNRRSFFQGAEAMLKGFPDHRPKSAGNLLRQPPEILPVPLQNSFHTDRPPRISGNRNFTIVWNHRWEYDKAPERLYKALCILQDRNIDFSLYLLGKKFRNTPAVFETLHKQFRNQLLRFGPVSDRDRYLQCLHSADAVVSTALQEFQGLAIQEGIACGCIPVAPKRLAYPEILAAEFLYDSFENNEGKEALALAEALGRLATLHQQDRLPESPPVDHLSWNNLKARYRSLLIRLTETRPYTPGIV